jgi:Uma2 family endonuclease
MSALVKLPARRAVPSWGALPIGPDDSARHLRPEDWPVAPDGLPTLFEDEGQDEMGETSRHREANDILFYGVQAHLAGRPEFAVLSNMNLYYRPRPAKAHVSPDVMVVRPPERLPRNLKSYRLGPKRPVPVLTAEVLSLRSYQQQDLSNKPVLYRRLGVTEYLLIDTTGELLPERLLIRRATGLDDWLECQDQDGGITSDLGFRVVIEPDGALRVLDATTGHRYPRPAEADTALTDAERRIRELEAEIARLKAAEKPPRRGKKK